MSADNWPGCIAFTLQAEGGFVDDPNDPGGLTNFGISQAAYPGLDIRALTQADASAIYRRDYWNKVAGDALPAGVDLMVFDMGVNAGNGTSAGILQRCLGVDADGAIGPMTLLAIKGADKAQLIAALHDAQMAFYHHLGNWSIYGEGWTNRVNARAAAATQMAG